MREAHSQFAVDGYAKTSDLKMEFLWTYHDDVICEFLQPFQQS